MRDEMLMIKMSPYLLCLICSGSPHAIFCIGTISNIHGRCSLNFPLSRAHLGRCVRCPRFPLFNDSVSLLVSPQTRLSPRGLDVCPFFPSQAKLRCETCRLALAQPCLTTSQNIFIQANFTGVLTMVHSFCVGHGRCVTQRFRRQVKPSRGQWWYKWLAPTHCRRNRMWSRTQDVVFINYRLSKCSYYIRGGRGK